MQRQLIALGAAVLLVVLVAGLAAGTFFLEPLGRVLAAIEKINRQEYEVTLDADRPDEFGQLGAAFNAMTRGLREGTIIRRFVSASVRQLVRQDRQERQAHLTEATVLFSSFLGFEEFQRHHGPEAVFFLLQQHLEAAAAATAQYGGEIDKMVGDKVMIVFRHAAWSKPWSPAEAAVQVAQALRRQVAAASCPLTLAIGINAGTVVAGAMGASEVRLDLTVIGDPINLAARLATLAHTTSGTRIVLSGQVREHLPPDLRCRRLPFRSVRGKTQAVEAWLLEESPQ
jgi:adenylate cyclase